MRLDLRILQAIAELSGERSESGNRPRRRVAWECRRKLVFANDTPVKTARKSKVFFAAARTAAVDDSDEA